VLEHLHLTDPKQIAALLHPLRQQILEQLKERSATPSEVARAIGQPANKVHYHVRILEKAGLVRLVETRQVGSVTETYFAPVANRITITSDLAENTPGNQQILKALGHHMKQLLEELRRNLESSSPDAAGLVLIGRIRPGSPDAAAEVESHIDQLRQEFAKARETRPNDRFRLMTIFIPMEPEPPEGAKSAAPGQELTPTAGGVASATARATGD
jgi:DNA-binding transcriptional ArsR family regulator